MGKVWLLDTFIGVSIIIFINKALIDDLQRQR